VLSSGAGGAREFPDVRFTLIGRQTIWNAKRRTPHTLEPRLRLHAQVVERPITRVRPCGQEGFLDAPRLDLVKAREADACVSAGTPVH